MLTVIQTYSVIQIRGKILMARQLNISNAQPLTCGENGETVPLDLVEDDILQLSSKVLRFYPNDKPDNETTNYVMRDGSWEAYEVFQRITTVFYIDP
ncbi:hypothetical protein PR048_028517 [Dryococelus australis]|uniref:Uncharacterized protein n=1 Tax=Dryococelus australis TaxID=614101 RepID=A0ABQ9GAV4_9NEOP|nr:hypothetical protein PR048_028517 [Dryococelus australis]